MTKLMGDLGGAGARAYIKHYGGKPHIIIKGRPGLRKVLTGTKYGIKNPKVVTMGLGRHAAVGAAKAGGIVTVVLMSAYRIIDFILTDEQALSHLIGHLATDVVKVGLTTAASIGAAMFVGGFAIAVGPIAAVVLVGVLMTFALDAIDEQFGISDKVVAGIDEMGDNIQSFAKTKQKELERELVEAVESVFDYAVESARRTLIEVAKHSLHRFLPRGPRL